MSAYQSGQATKPATDDRTARQVRTLLENCLKTSEELDYLTAKVATLEKLSRNDKELIAALEEQVATQEKTIAALKAIGTKGDKIEALTAEQIKSYQASLDAAKAEIARWQRKASFWKSFAAFGVPIALLVGGVVGFALGNK